jgi:hypothetical protein
VFKMKTRNIIMVIGVIVVVAILALYLGGNYNNNPTNTTTTTFSATTTTTIGPTTTTIGTTTTTFSTTTTTTISSLCNTKAVGMGYSSGVCSATVPITPGSGPVIISGGSYCSAGETCWGIYSLTCVDSDGSNYANAGYITITWADGHETKHNDVCSTATGLVEKVCTKNGFDWSSEQVHCPNQGFTGCSNGKCV